MSHITNFLHHGGLHRLCSAEALVAGQVGALGHYRPDGHPGLSGLEDDNRGGLPGEGSQLDTDQGAQDLGQLLPELVTHAAVHSQVERAGETHEAVDDQDNEVSHIIIHPGPGLIKGLISVEGVILCHLRTEGVEHRDDHQGDLNDQEDRDDDG